MNVNTVHIVSDERGFELHLNVDEMPEETPDGTLIFNIQDVAEILYDQVKARIGPWLRERDEARREFNRRPDLPETDHPYALSDPKHPRYHSIHADIWDMRDGK